MVCRGKRNGLEGSSAPHQRTSEASAGCAARRTSTTKVEVAGSRKSRKSYRQIAIFTLLPSTATHPEVFFFCSLLPLFFQLRTEIAFRKLETVLIAKVRRRYPVYPLKKREGGEEKKKETSSVSVAYYFTHYTNVGAPGYLAAAPSIPALLVARCATPERDCGCETS